MSVKLIEHRVLISISDPWEFVTKNGESRTGTVVDEIVGTTDAEPTLHIQLDEKIKLRNIEAHAVFAQFRHVGSAKQQLMSGQLVPCNFSTMLDGTELSASAGAIAFIGGLKLLP